MGSLRDLKLTTRLALLVGVFTLAFGAFAYVSFSTLERVRVGGPVYEQISSGKELIADILPPPAYIIEAYLLSLQLSTEKDRGAIGAATLRSKALKDEYEERHGHWQRALPEGPLRQAMVVRAHRPAQEFFALRDRELLPAVASGDLPRAQEIARGPLKMLYEEHRTAIDEAVRLANKQNEEHERNSATELARSAQVLKGLTAMVAALLLVLAWFVRDLGQSLARRVGQVAAEAQRAADGDLTISFKVEGEDEVGQMARAVQQMSGGLASLVGRVKQSSVDLLSTATQIAAASTEQSATMAGLGASTTEVASASREISTTSQELLETMTQVNDLASGASQRAEEGRQALGEMEHTMANLAEASGSISAKLSTIRERAVDISGVVTTITKVADQTNLLSVNAAIEAEKAGEYGRGFLVLAREIRRLADQTAISTLDIERIVRTMQAAVTAGVMEMDKFSDEMRSSRERVGRVGRQLGEVIAQVQAVLARFENVSEGMRNQSEGARQISVSMGQLTESMRQMTASLKEFNNATVTMRDAISGLKQEIVRYKVAGLSRRLPCSSCSSRRTSRPTLSPRSTSSRSSLASTSARSTTPPPGSPASATSGARSSPSSTSALASATAPPPLPSAPASPSSARGALAPSSASSPNR